MYKNSLISKKLADGLEVFATSAPPSLHSKIYNYIIIYVYIKIYFFECKEAYPLVPKTSDHQRVFHGCGLGCI